MIEELRIQGIGVIDEARLEFSPGLTVITGETGAGKTMILSGLELLRGARADTGQLRDPAAGAEVDAVVSMDGGVRDAVAEVLEGLALSGGDDDALIIRRTVAPQGKSRAHVAGRPVPLSALSDVWVPLIAVHGQADQARLREATWQRSVVDRFGGSELGRVRDDYERTWQELQLVSRDLQELHATMDERERTARLLRLGIAEIDEVAPEAGEDAALNAEAAVLAHAGTLRDAVLGARAVLSGAGDDIDPGAVLSRLAHAREHLDSVAGLDERLAAVAERVVALTTEAVDIDGELGEYLRSLDADPHRQAWVEDRRARLNALRKAYGATIEEVLLWRESSAKEVLAVDGSADVLADLQERRAQLAARAREFAKALSQQRVEAARRLASAVEVELRSLAMPDARIEIGVESDLDTLRAHGADEVQVSLVPHPGASPRPIGKGASGGELSRLALAFEVALAGQAPTPTMVFDEIDAGIGGAVAVEVGRRLARLAQRTQVIVVTHLPQVAAFADRHLVVSKDTDGVVTSADVRETAGDDRVKELVRMLSGLEDSSFGAAHAQELLDVAAEERGAPQAARNVRPRKR